MNESIIKYDGPCENCGEGGTRYEQDEEGPHYYCWKHAIEHGLCPVCGSIVGGIEIEEFGYIPKYGMCSSCCESIQDEIAQPDEEEDFWDE